MPRFIRRLARRPPFSVMLVALVVALTALTAATLGGLARMDQRARSRAIVDAAIAQAARLVATNAARFLRDAESAALLGPALVAQGQLDPGDDRALERFVVAVLRAYPHLTWVSYGDRDDRFVGAWRDGAGQLHVNRSFPVGARIRLEEDRLLPDGRRVAVRRAEDHGYRPRERPYYRKAEAQRGLVWTEPYEFFAGGGFGITCAAPVVRRTGEVRGVFTVDFSLERLAGFLDAVQVSARGRVFLASWGGGFLVGRPGTTDQPGLDSALVASVARHIGLDEESAFQFEHGGERYLGRAVALGVGDLGWLAEVVVPERDYTEQVDAQARLALSLGLLALALALAAGVAMARWIGRPLRELAEAARRIRHGRLDVALVPRSRDEIGVLTRAMGDMVQALKDRDFIRDTLGRYVSPELAERFLRDRNALRLGGELRDVVLLMSDLRGFSELSERLGPEAMIELVNRYLARMTPVILEHGGTINEFIGDAILALFGVPFGRPDDAARAVRCAWRMQQAMDDLNAANRALGLPELAMGIGLHAGPVVAGNIGSPERVKYGVVGPPVNLAASLQQRASGGEILLSEALLARVAHLVRVGPGSLLPVKGTGGAVTVYAVRALVEAGGAASGAGGEPGVPAGPGGGPVEEDSRVAAGLQVGSGPREVGLPEAADVLGERGGPRGGA